jgi:hypothetical protein
MLYVLFALWMVVTSFAVFLVMSLDWRTGDWKDPRFKGKSLPF